MPINPYITPAIYEYVVITDGFDPIYYSACFVVKVGFVIVGLRLYARSGSTDGQTRLYLLSCERVFVACCVLCSMHKEARNFQNIIYHF